MEGSHARCGGQTLTCWSPFQSCTRETQAWGNITDKAISLILSLCVCHSVRVLSLGGHIIFDLSSCWLLQLLLVLLWSEHMNTVYCSVRGIVQSHRIIYLKNDLIIILKLASWLVEESLMWDNLSLLYLSPSFIHAVLSRMSWAKMCLLRPVCGCFCRFRHACHISSCMHITCRHISWEVCCAFSCKGHFPNVSTRRFPLTGYLMLPH